MVVVTTVGKTTAFGTAVINKQPIRYAVIEQDASGKDVTKLIAGTYTITGEDEEQVHIRVEGNFSTAESAQITYKEATPTTHKEVTPTK